MCCPRSSRWPPTAPRTVCVFDPETTIGIIYGELTAPFDSDRVQAVRALFADTGIHFRVTEHIREEIWSKFRLNVCKQSAAGDPRAGVGCYSDSAHIKAISDGLRRELEAIAAAKGIDLSKAAAASTHGSTVPPTARYSTLQDLDAGRHTEIDMFSGALMRMGRELGIPDALQRIHLPHDQGSGGKKRRPV